MLDKYDAATYKLGEGWSLPTISQWNELWSKCIVYPVTNSNDALIGVKITGKNNNSIYLPVTGIKNVLYTSETGAYWTKYGDIREPTKYAWAFEFQLPSYYDGKAAVFRYNGMPIRPVKKKETTLINNIKVDNKFDIDIYYNLQGQRVASPQRGSIYIKNGKKIIY